MAGGKTTQTGLGDAKPNRATRLGLKVERKKIVTKRGLVAPSPENPTQLEEFIPESDRKGRESEIVRKSTQPDPAASEAGGVYHKRTDPLGMTPPPPLHDLQPEDSASHDEDLKQVDSTRELETDPIGMDPPFPEVEEPAESIAARVAAHEDITPKEGSEIEDPEARSRFRTAPGGGLNRVSGGREHARAYVSPVTVKPGTPNTPVTGAVKVMDVVENAVRAYRTEPSLLRRRLSSLPPAFPPPQTRMHLLFGAIAIGLVLGAMMVWAAIRTKAFQTEAPGQSTNAARIEARPPTVKKEKISRNESETGPKTKPEGENAPAPLPAEAQEQKSAPPVIPKETAQPSNSKSSPVHEEAPVVNLPRSVTKPAVEKTLPVATEKPPEKQVGTGEAPKTSSKDLWLE